MAGSTGEAPKPWRKEPASQMGELSRQVADGSWWHLGRFSSCGDYCGAEAGSTPTAMPFGRELRVGQVTNPETADTLGPVPRGFGLTEACRFLVMRGGAEKTRANLLRRRTVVGTDFDHSRRAGSVRLAGCERSRSGGSLALARRQVTDPFSDDTEPQSPHGVLRSG